MVQSILITGANGFVGGHLARALASSGTRSLLLTGRQETYSHGTLPPGCQYLQADLENPSEAMTRSRFDIIIHLAAALSTQDSSTARRALMDANVSCTLSMLELAREHGAFFVFPSSGLLYGDQPGPHHEDLPLLPLNFYTFSKLMAEQLIEHFHRYHAVKALVLRASLIYGPGQGGAMFIPSIVKALVDGEEFPMTAGQQKRDFIYIDDLIAALDSAISQQLTGTFNLGGGVAPTLAEVAEMAGQITGNSSKLRMGAIPYRKVESWEYFLQIGKLQKALGWSPRVDLKTGLEKVVQYEKDKRRRLGK